MAMRKGCRYFVTFTDDTTHFTTFYLMRTKDEVLAAYKSFEDWALTQGHCMAIKVLHSDHGGEYLSDTFNAHLAAAGTVRKLTVHDTLQLNGVAECLTARCSSGSVPLHMEAACPSHSGARRCTMQSG